MGLDRGVAEGEGGDARRRVMSCLVGLGVEKWEGLGWLDEEGSEVKGDGIVVGWRSLWVCVCVWGGEYIKRGNGVQLCGGLGLCFIVAEDDFRRREEAGKGGLIVHWSRETKPAPRGGVLHKSNLCVFGRYCFGGEVCAEELFLLS